MINKLTIRADATTEIGTGHVMRCLALAQGWKEKGGQAVFLSHCESQALRNRIISEGFDLVPIKNPHPHPDDLDLTLQVLSAKDHNPSTASLWLALDGYHFTPDYQKAIRDAGIRLLVIDDMNHLPRYHAEILLNQNIHAPDLHYHCDPDTTLLLGPRYILLRREFIKYREFKREIAGRAKNILVTMGGSDLENITLKVIEAIKLLNDPTLEVKVVVGPTNPHAQTIRNSVPPAQAAPLKRELYRGARTRGSLLLVEKGKDMPQLMTWADMAITAGGSTCWELAYMGVPMLTAILADNQEAIVESLERRSVSRNMGFLNTHSVDIVLEMMSDLIKDEDRRSKMSANAIHLVDGAGTKRVLSQLKENE